MERNKILELYTDIIQKVLESSADCLQYIKQDNQELLLAELERRYSLIDIFQRLHLRVSESFQEAQQDINILIQKISSMDQEILDYLAQKRTDMKKEISLTYRNKENIKGYNLSSTK